MTEFFSFILFILVSFVFLIVSKVLHLRCCPVFSLYRKKKVVLSQNIYYIQHSEYFRISYPHPPNELKLKLDPMNPRYEDM